MVKIKDVFKQIVKEIIAPTLKNHGFKKKGNNFASTFPGFSWTINVQSSSWNTREDVAFTINMGVYIESLYGTYYQDEPPKFPLEVDSVMRLRISALKNTTNQYEDSWYKLTSATNLEDLIEQVKDDLERVIIPHFQQLQSIQDVIQGLEKREAQGYHENPHVLAVLYHECGDRGAAKERLRSVFAECQTDLDRQETKELAERLGFEITKSNS
ncbi:DUF4304 domain-containing protein [Fictibacillus phosphorivorans]|uniref:DUF4304 domain-containing protein n=1 Tax=Fictibacillus phosphorivorans TaxID=1221500 RepID=UPI00129324C5|nr:DUF4304 domain-containing protein [Fictibacillus phosphorivorans]MQR94634.1 DUF4304 domain-containing protein [Fictibacillus phosphorivorans]